MIDEAYSQKATRQIFITGNVGAGKSTVTSLLLKGIQVKERIFHREANKSSDNFRILLGILFHQDNQIPRLLLDCYRSVAVGDSTFKDYLQEPKTSFYFAHHGSLDTITSNDRTDFERAYQAYQSTYPLGYTPELASFLRDITKSHMTLHEFKEYDEETNKIFYPTFWQKLIEYSEALTYYISLLKRKNREAVRMQYIANQAHNRVSRSPTPQKKEPPVGGVKVGGEQHNFSRYVATMLYLKQKRRETSPTSSTGKYANYGREGPGLFHLKGHAQWPKTSFRLKMKTQVRSLMSWKKIKTQTKSLLDKNKTMHKLSPIQANLILRR